MHSISSPFGSSLAGGAIPRLPAGGAAQSGGPAALGAGLRFKAWLAESGWYRGAGCRQALLERNNYLLRAAARETETLTGETKFKSLFERQVKLVGGFDRNAQPAEARAVRAMTRLIGLARLAGTDSYEARAHSVIREAQAEQAAAERFRTSEFHQMLENQGVSDDLINQFEEDFCVRCASCARADPSTNVEAIVKNQLGHFLPTDGGLEKLLRLNLSEPSSASVVLRNYLAEMRNRMWTINERNSAELSGFSPDHQLRRHMLRFVLEAAVLEVTRQFGVNGFSPDHQPHPHMLRRLELAVREVSRQSEVKAWARHVRNAKEHCMSKIDLVSDNHLTDLTLEKFISKNFYDLLPFKWEDDADDEDHASEDNTQVSSRSEVISDADALKLVKLDWQRDPNTGDPVESVAKRGEGATLQPPRFRGRQ